ncbi:MAG: hypothetical protein LBD85_06390, partial [Oscillospiraceae bacterium]|nr:hypothetical protein [Oscillospiraceae bacterium]
GAVVALIGWMLTPMLLRTIIRVSDEVVFEYAVLYMRIYCVGVARRSYCHAEIFERDAALQDREGLLI